MFVQYTNITSLILAASVRDKLYMKNFQLVSIQNKFELEIMFLFLSPITKNVSI